jgi:fused signal recognition particle receptor
MDELKKMQRVLDRALPGAPHEIWLVLDATTGQNGVLQVQQFHACLGLTGLVLTKLDSTAKGGIVVQIADQFGLPIRYIGIGEGVEDLRPFDAAEFAEALLEQ